MTYYFATSEQTPSSVGLGVLMTKENAVETAGGFIIQVMPNAKDETITLLEDRLASFSSVTDTLEAGKSIEEMMEGLLYGLNPEILEQQGVEFRCNCSDEKTRGMIASLPKEELADMIEEGKDVEVVCHFCGKKYAYSPDEIREMLANKA